MLCYRTGDVLLMSRQQIPVFGVGRSCVRSVWLIQIKATADWSRWPSLPQQPDDRTHSVKADKGWTNTHQHTPLTHSVTPSVQTVEEDVMKERRAADELCVLHAWMDVWVSEWQKGRERTEVNHDTMEDLTQNQLLKGWKSLLLKQNVILSRVLSWNNQQMKHIYALKLQQHLFCRIRLPVTVLTFIVQTKEVCGAVEVKNYEYIVLKPQSRHHNSHDNISD